MMKNNIVVVIEGGLVTEVYSNSRDIDIEVIDRDIMKDVAGYNSADIQKIIDSKVEKMLVIY